MDRRSEAEYGLQAKYGLQLRDAPARPSSKYWLARTCRTPDSASAANRHECHGRRDVLGDLLRRWRTVIQSCTRKQHFSIRLYEYFYDTRFLFGVVRDRRRTR